MSPISLRLYTGLSMVSGHISDEVGAPSVTDTQAILISPTLGQSKTEWPETMLMLGR